MKTLLLTLLLLTSLEARIKEKTYQKYFASKIDGSIEYKLNNGCRVDILTRTTAIEVDFIRKNYEAVGQALYYAIKTGKNPGIVFIYQSNKKNRKKLQVALELANKYDIKIWTINRTTFDIRRIR